MTKKQNASENITVVYLGVRDIGDGKLCCGLIPLDLMPGEAAQAERLASNFGGRGLTGTVGGIYTVKGERSEDGRISTIVADLKMPPDGWKQYGNEDMVAVWEVADKAARVAKQARSLAAKAKRDGQLRSVLDPLIVQYNKTNAIGKLAMEVVILTELRKGRRS